MYVNQFFDDIYLMLDKFDVIGADFAVGDHPVEIENDGGNIHGEATIFTFEA